MRDPSTATVERQTASTAEQDLDQRPAAGTSEAKQTQPSVCERRGLGRITIRWFAIGFSAAFWLLLVWLLFY